MPWQEDDEAKRSTLQQVLGLSDEDANIARAASMGESGSGAKIGGEEEDAFF